MGYGAGILLIEQSYCNQIGIRNEPALILFGDKRGFYQELGGRCEDKDEVYISSELDLDTTYAKIASREAREESNNLINIHYKKIMKLPYITMKKKYRCYMLVIKPKIFSLNYFYINQEIKFNNEINNVTRFYVLDLLKTGLKPLNKLMCNNTMNVLCSIRERTAYLFKYLLNKNIDLFFDIINNATQLNIKFNNKLYLLS